MRLRSSFPNGLSDAFQFTHPGGVRHTDTTRDVANAMFQFTHPGGVRLCDACKPRRGTLRFNSRTPGGVRLVGTVRFVKTWRFQFTHPGRGATSSSANLSRMLYCFNSRTPGGVRQHSSSQTPYLCSFNSRTPGGVRRIAVSEQTTPHERFNSRTPGGVRLVVAMRPISLLQFQFTHPGRGATSPHFIFCKEDTVSIHAPREGCDLLALFVLSTLLSFNSRTPGGVRRHCPFCSARKCFGFNSRTPGGVRLLHL